MSKNFNLTVNEFDTLALNLRSGDEELFEKIFLSNFETCVVNLQAKYKCAYEEAYDATMDALIQFRNRIIENKIKFGNLNYLFFLMASQIFVRNKKQFKFLDIQENLFEHDISTYSDLDIHNMRKAWNELSLECRELLAQNIFNGTRLKEIAEDDDRTHLAVRKQKRRCLNKLMLYYRKHSKRNRHLISAKLTPDFIFFS